jgi:DNA-binding Lrp family transcriptional regulator
LDELDVKLLRALTNDGVPAPANFQLRTSLREIARRLGADDMTVANRYKMFQEAGLIRGWILVVNPGLYGYEMKEILVDVEPESMKDDAIRKLRLIHGIVMIVNAYGKSLVVQILYKGAEELSRTIELVSRITNTERVVSFYAPLPKCETKRLTGMDWARSSYPPPVDMFVVEDYQSKEHTTSAQGFEIFLGSSAVCSVERLQDCRVDIGIGLSQLLHI